MNLQFTEEQHMMRKMVRDFANKEVAPIVQQMDQEDYFPIELIKQMGDIGLMGIPIPEQYGGSGMDFPSYIIAIHELSKVSASVGVILSVHTSVGTNPILYFGTEEQKQKYIPKLASGEFLGAFALTEPGAGSDAGSLKMKAVREGEEYILNGSKVFITNGEKADTFIVFARTDSNAGNKGVTAFIVERNTSGFEIGKKEHKMGMNGSGTVTLNFDNCRIPAEQRLGEEGEGFKIAMANLNVGRIGIAAQSLGIAEAALEHAVGYAKEREQFGKPIARNQGISFKLADMATSVEAAKLLTYHAANLRHQGIDCGKEASMAKMTASQAAMNVATEAIQVYGGYGYTEDYPVERFFRDAKVCEIYEGTNEIQRVVIGKHVLK
ncbi:acyl-CoA dehydrogenase [Pontibacillus litoralis]|uniref:Acyl-CoA dehydrogenase n=1 Tax=Pontibacillus litoralis JSM 072002 TaxID=1385512 RepID=A0A0A5HS77_9BACI|nr:acyl-CoA dehydrogenase [Pontibacillus litoralis]KGX86477.1 acyl-CoA dehydrogenase [Pontibacillus litoralis JSM 072002]